MKFVMNPERLGSKYFVSFGKTAQMVMPAFSGSSG